MKLNNIFISGLSATMEEYSNEYIETSNRNVKLEIRCHLTLENYKLLREKFFEQNNYFDLEIVPHDNNILKEAIREIINE